MVGGGYFYNITQTLLLFTGHVRLLFSKTWMHFGLRVSFSSLLTIPLKSTVKLIDTHAMSLEIQLLCRLKTSEHLLEDRLTVGGVGCLHCMSLVLG